jgi:hypothetical protein
MYQVLKILNNNTILAKEDDNEIRSMRITEKMNGLRNTISRHK